MNERFLSLPLSGVLATLLIAASGLADEVQREWTIDSVQRTALVVVPDKAAETPSPVVFAFHGHGGRIQSARRQFGIERHWPEAIVVYMQGLPTATPRDPQGERPGWQTSVGQEADRDLKFFDAVLASLKQDYKVDEARIYATGHSNGGGFTYFLWAERHDVFAAVAPSASGAGLRLQKLKALPAMHIGGETDQIVPFELQTATMTKVREINGCEQEGKPWHSSGPLTGTVYASPGGTPFVSVIYPGTHKYPAEAPELIVRFFKEHVRKPAGQTSAE
jgi:polyhydroxybutyrate depolymerase